MLRLARRIFRFAGRRFRPGRRLRAGDFAFIVGGRRCVLKTRRRIRGCIGLIWGRHIFLVFVNGPALFSNAHARKKHFDGDRLSRGLKILTPSFPKSLNHYASA